MYIDINNRRYLMLYLLFCNILNFSTLIIMNYKLLITYVSDSI